MKEPELVLEARQLTQEKLELAALRDAICQDVMLLFAADDEDKRATMSDIYDEYSINFSRSERSQNGHYRIVIGFASAALKRTIFIEGQSASVIDGTWDQALMLNRLGETDRQKLNVRIADFEDLRKFKELAEGLRITPLGRLKTLI